MNKLFIAISLTLTLSFRLIAAPVKAHQNPEELKYRDLMPIRGTADRFNSAIAGWEKRDTGEKEGEVFKAKQFSKNELVKSKSVSLVESKKLREALKYLSEFYTNAFEGCLLEGRSIRTFPATAAFVSLIQQANNDFSYLLLNVDKPEIRLDAQKAGSSFSALIHALKIQFKKVGEENQTLIKDNNDKLEAHLKTISDILDFEVPQYNEEETSVENLKKIEKIQESIQNEPVCTQSAGHDITPPEIDAKSATFYNEDNQGKLTEVKGPVAPGSKLVFEIAAEDKKSGVKNGYIYMRGPSGKFISILLHPVKDKPGILRGAEGIDKNEASGEFKVTTLNVTDNAGNQREVDKAVELPRINIQNPNEDITPPELDAKSSKFYTEDNQGKLTEVKGPVVAGSKLVFEIAAEDKKSGVKNGYIYMRGPSDKFISILLHPVKDKPGILRGSERINQFEASGEFKVTTLNVTDNAGNQQEVDKSAELPTITVDNKK